MTLEEKLGQLQQLDGEGNGNFRPEHLELIRKGLLGSTLNVRGAQRTNQVQRVAMNESRLKIPVLVWLRRDSRLSHDLSDSAR